ncbi:MAG: type 1 glutamine amidotransferase domain-containing protein [Candidatus Limnocylindria bacterium]
MDELKGARVAVLVEETYEDLELWYPLFRLREAGAETILVGPSAGETYRSKHGYVAKADRGSADVSASDVDAVIIPGGYAPDRMRRDAGLVALVREADAQGKVVAAICHAGWMLVSAGIAKGRRVTCFHSIKDDLAAAGARYEDRAVVRDGNLITSRQPADLPEFAAAIVAALAEAKAKGRSAAAAE